MFDIRQSRTALLLLVKKTQRGAFYHWGVLSLNMVHFSVAVSFTQKTETLTLIKLILSTDLYYSNIMVVN